MTVAPGSVTDNVTGEDRFKMTSRATNKASARVAAIISRLLPCVFLMLSLVHSAVAQDLADSRKWTVTAECQMILVPQKLALGLIEELSDAAKIDNAWKQVEQMIERGEIEVVASLLLKGDEGRKLVTESVEEMRYPTEFDPPQVPEKMPQENATEVLKAWPVIGITPTAFETRNVGQTLELEANVSEDGNWLKADVVPQHVRFLRWVKFDAGRLANGERLAIEQPYFHTMKDTLGLHLQNGQRVLVGVHNVPDSDKKAYELFVLRVTAAKDDASK